MDQFFPKPGEQIVLGEDLLVIGNRIGSGNFGTCFECVDFWGNRLVAKVFHPIENYASVKARWTKETDFLLQLRHPNVTYVRYAFERNSAFYIVMERCEWTVSDLIQMLDPAGMDPMNWIAFVSRGVLQALDYVHSWGVSHKDVHGGNVFIAHTWDQMVSKDPAWILKLGDFGVSNQEGNITLQSAMFNRIRPPELLDASFGPATGKLFDIYQAGLLLLHLLLKEEIEYTPQDIVNGRPRQLAEANLPEPFRTAISKALRRRTHYRTRSAKQLFQDLQLPPLPLPPAPPSL